jgi:hypothetical protein
MNKMPVTKRVAILKCLTDGMSIRAASRITGASKGAILRLLAEVGEFCEGYQFYRLRNLPTVREEADEQWSFVGAKARNATPEGHGDIWTFCGIDADSKLVMSWLVGARTPENAGEFMADLASRCANRIQLSTDGHAMCLNAVRKAFGFARVDYARVVKVFGQSAEGATDASRARPRRDDRAGDAHDPRVADSDGVGRGGHDALRRDRAGDSRRYRGRDDWRDVPDAGVPGRVEGAEAEAAGGSRSSVNGERAPSSRTT